MVVLFVLPNFTQTSFGQVATGSIGGRVVDDTGGVIPGATVTVTSLDTGRTRRAMTDDVGQFLAPGLEIGTYRLTVSQTGFKEFVREGIIIEVNRTARVNITLPVGETTDTVTVTGDAPLVESTQSTVSEIVDGKRIMELPLSGRNTVELVRLVPGVTSMATESSLGFTEYRVSTGGADAFQTNFLMDGGTNVSAFRNTGSVLPNPDAIAEFRVIRNMTAEYGRMGGATINTITRSGTNRFGATLFEFHRNRALNARQWQQSDTSPLVQNQFGGTAGGPIFRDRTFFFVSYQQLERRSAAFSNSAIVPTALERQGNFSQSKIKPKKPDTGQPYPSNTIPLSEFDPVSKYVLDKYVPPSNRLDGRYEIRLPVPENAKQFLLKADHDLNQSHRLAFNYLIGASYLPNPLLGNIPYGTQVFDGTQQNIGLTETWTQSPTLLNSLRLGYLRVVGKRFISPELSLKDFGGKWQTDGLDFPPELDVVGYMQLRTRFLGPTIDNSYQITDTLNWLKGRHSVKFGGDVIHNRGANYSGLWSNGNFAFNGAFTGNALADFLIGRSSSFLVSSVNRAVEHSSYYGLFLQDDFRIVSRLTLNLGLRYEIFTPAIEPHNQMSTYIPGHQSTIPGAPPGLAFYGEPGVPSKLRNYDRDNVGPRLGFALDVFGDGRTSIRAGYGLYYSGLTLNSQSVATVPYIFQNTYFDARFSDPWAANNNVALLPYRFDPAKPVFFFPVSPTVSDQNWHEPNFHQFNLTLQKQLGASYMVEIGYFGNMGRQLRTQIDLNEPKYIPGGSTASNIQSRRPIYPEYYGVIAYNLSLDESDHHALQMSVKKRFSSGLNFDANYVFGKATDFGGGIPVSHYRWDLEHGRGNLDQRHRFFTSFIWEPVWAKDLSGVLKQVLDGWQLSGILEFQSGRPLTITAGSDVNLNGMNTDRPNLGDNPLLDPNRSRSEVAKKWFETTVFSKPKTGDFGTAGRNILDGPGSKGLDLGLSRSFSFKGQRLQFRSEFFNAFNWVNLANPNTTLSSGNFGKILTAGSPRVIQFGLKLLLNSED